MNHLYPLLTCLSLALLLTATPRQGESTTAQSQPQLSPMVIELPCTQGDAGCSDGHLFVISGILGFSNCDEATCGETAFAPDAQAHNLTRPRRQP